MDYEIRLRMLAPHSAPASLTQDLLDSLTHHAGVDDVSNPDAQGVYTVWLTVAAEDPHLALEVALQTLPAGLLTGSESFLSADLRPVELNSPQRVAAAV